MRYDVEEHLAHQAEFKRRIKAEKKLVEAAAPNMLTVLLEVETLVIGEPMNEGTMGRIKAIIKEATK